MKFIRLSASILFLLSTTAVKAQLHQYSPTDIGVVNKERILYWLDKRDDLAGYENKSAAVTHFIGKATAIHAVKYVKKQGAVTSKIKNAQSAHSASLLPTNTKTTVKVLAILVDFPDLPHNDNGLQADDTAMYYADYDVQHYQQMLFSISGYEGPSGQTLNSAYQYYQQASGNSLDFTGQVYGWVRADKNAKAYGERQGDDKDIDAPSLVKEAVEKAITQFNIDLTDYDLTDLDDVDGDGITNEPNGIIDHVMIFHSSVGEEAGGGLLGTDAIWSHRYYVYNEQFQATDLPNSPVDLFGYTINPIDAGIGVVVHEFGHDLGLPDEYDLTNSDIGEPVASWSVMSSGSWAGVPRGSEPVMFSPYALEYLQNRYSGNWVNQRTFTLDEINEVNNLVVYHASATGEELNQVKVILPAKLKTFNTPVEGAFQYYSGRGNSLDNTMTQEITIPSSQDETLLTLKAHYSIESDYDYVQITVNGQAIASQYTHDTNPFHSQVVNFISGDSATSPESQQPHNYLQHIFDLTEFAGQTINLGFRYVTDSFVEYYGFVVDDMKISQGNTVIWQDNAELQSQFTLQGFSRVGAYVYGSPQHYYLQQRSYEGVDSGLQSEQYSPGLLLWLANLGYENNNTSAHPGEGLILVIDADQNAIAKGTSQTPASTEIQIRDAAFSVYDQRQGLGDSHLTANSEFNDATDYSFVQQPESGVKLEPFGLSFSIADQASDNSRVEVDLNYNAQAGITYTVNNLTVTFEVKGMELSPTDSFNWQFGNDEQSHELNPTMTFPDYGSYDITFSRTTEFGETTTEQTTISLSEPLKLADIESQITQGKINATVAVSGGHAPYSYTWDFGDGNTSSSIVASHSYQFSGNYSLSVTVIDSQQTALTQRKNISVEVPLSSRGEYTANDLTVIFKSDTLGGYGSYSFLWDFGDGDTANTANPTHTYQQAGSYTVTLTVTDDETAHETEFTLLVTVQKQVASSGSSGGSFGWILLGSLGLLLRRKER
ncbi:immune inhibitor A [Pseudoalteromonas shioyasakiensis]|uniref:immune inhibitor A domain-containing protein n=1 Tax=Pseudoalteromonas shioyasakiensis TaxID=1190813 RepID=UPI002117656E|nr:immune inhibitor A [Pseudoalteromonas shioyasakiensis]